MMAFNFQMDRKMVRKRKLHEEKNISDWVGASYQKRLEALEFIRNTHESQEHAAETVQRVYKVTRRK